ncbi:MAG: 2-hydroxyisocaproyl-CoA dehydratase activator [Syntrophomonadaceae bacterium]|nr:2-hydroxyisocaproyl-CoA dehydratase activator [Bacillota bacterium]
MIDLYQLGLDIGAENLKALILTGKEGCPTEIVKKFPILKVEGQPLMKIRQFLNILKTEFQVEEVFLGLTGTGSGTLASLLHIDPIDESNALLSAFNLYYPQVRTVLEMGRESQKYLLFGRDELTGRLVLEDINLGNKCAAGSGSFLSYMYKRLNFPSLESFIFSALEVENSATLSGRCGVFTESDIVHLYQKGVSRERIAAGIHQALARNFRTVFCQGKELRPEIVFIGGVSQNFTMVKYLARELSQEIVVPEHNLFMSAIGAALRAFQKISLSQAIELLDQYLSLPLQYVVAPALNIKEESILKPRSEGIPTEFIPRAALGVDIGSVSTKAALITEISDEIILLGSYYRRTNGDPLSAVQDTVKKIYEQIRDTNYQIGEIVVSTTGSGRYLTGDYLGADEVINEITSQANGTSAFVKDVDDIFEIGGQDSKFISLKNGVVVDFEMNKACAAGCGAFLEKQADRLGVKLEDFGGLALRGKKPPDLDWTCTVFSESAMVFYQQNNVPLEDLCAGVCLASAKNYLNKNLGHRNLNSRIAFQGATAFNKGMIAAFQTLLGKEVIVPPYPHLTGAIGAARLAYHKVKGKSNFRGFETIERSRYQIHTFECPHCPNHCEVNTFEIDGGSRYYYNDRCERYSAINKKRRDEELPDLFGEYEKLLFEVCSTQLTKVPEGVLKIGIPRGEMFNEYFPLFNTFFSELGFKVVTSDISNRQIIRHGLENTLSEICFPFKVAHGHVLDLLDKDVDYIFLPAILSCDMGGEAFRESKTCPYLQATPEIFDGALNLKEKGIKLLTPRLHLKDGYYNLNGALIRIGRELDKDPGEVEKALNKGLDALKRFRLIVEKRGKEILSQLKDNEIAFVVIGRPYVLYDSLINMNIGKKIRDLGIIPIPMDFLPISRVMGEVASVWYNAYSSQLQKTLACANLVKKDKRLRAIVLSYFACGPDSFSNEFFKEEVGEPSYIIQLDEHTADAGVLTRLEAFYDSVSREKLIGELPLIRTQPIPIRRLGDKRIWIPYSGESSRVLAAIFRSCGFDALVLPSSPDRGLNLARSVIAEDVCLPAFITIEDILYRANQRDFKPDKEAFFQGFAEGPCRFGMYHMLLRRILDRLGLKEVEMVTLGSNDYTSMGIMLTLIAYDALIANDLLFRMLLHTRPYEKNPGESEKIYYQYLEKLIELIPKYRKKVESFLGLGKVVLGIHLDPLKNLLKEASGDFVNVRRFEEKKPLIGVVGEFYVRIHEGANEDTLRKIERYGGEAWLAPPTEFLSYSVYIGYWQGLHLWKDTGLTKFLLKSAVGYLHYKLAKREEHGAFLSTLPYLEGMDDIPPQRLVVEGSKYLHPTFGGEAICSLGKAEDFAQRGLDGVVSVIPFNCMPGNIVKLLSSSFRRRHNNIPFLSLDFNGFSDSSREARLVSFMSQVKETWDIKRKKRLSLS